MLRRLASESFNFNSYGNFLVVFNERSLEFANKLENHLKNDPFKEADITDLTTSMAMDSVYGKKKCIRQNS